MTRLAFLMALTLAACSGDREVASGSVADTGGNKVDYVVKQDSAGGTTTTVQSADGTATIRTGTGAAAMPEGFPLYPGATIGSAISMDGGGGAKDGKMVAFKSGDAPERIVAFYRQAAQGAGYSVESQVSSGDMQMLAGKRGGSEDGFSLVVNKDQDGSNVTLVVGK